jgi:serine/threonine protein kinase
MPLSPQQAGRLAEHVFDTPRGDEAEVSSRGKERDEAAASMPLPQRIGHCLIRRLIGAGGMGVVYEAEQEKPSRTVAVKVMDRQFAARGQAALRRFEYEAQILARLDHPGIARIYEAGTWDDGSGGVPYFVMEFIPHARNIIEFAQTHNLSRRERLQLFARVCDAVHHGHQKGIIHRDLKPANIMVQERGGEESDGDAVDRTPQPKVIDFGVARAADTDISVTTMHTQPGDIVGTLQYMSPEQCDGDPHAIDVRSDVYALGIILYELLCGRLPYDLSNTAIPRATRIVQEQEPDRPSLMSPGVKGNLEAIMLKAIDKKPVNRYQSAGDLARDIRAHLAGDPIEARRPGIWSRIVRFVGRHPVLATGGVCLTLALLTFATTWLSIWYLSSQPHHVDLTHDGREARLISYGGRILYTWRSSVPGGISFAEFVSKTGSKGPLVVLGFRNKHDERSRGALCAFDPNSDPESPVWECRIKEEDLLPELQGLGINVAGFGVSWAMTDDIFPQIPGLEIVTAYSHQPSSLFAIVIYDIRGELLYRIWHDGGASRGYWMEDARLLVVVGNNSEVYWSERGFPDVGAPYPIVLYALEPRLGYIGTTWTTPSPRGDTTTLAWYRCLLPPEDSGLVGDWRVAKPLPGYDRGQFFTLALFLNGDKHSISWVLDSKANEVPGTRKPNDRWRIDKPLPDNQFELGDLPPIVPAPPKD